MRFTEDWVYIFQPTLEMYKHPPEGVITEVRAALRRIKDQGQSLELRWANPVYMQPLAPWKPNTLKTGVKKTRTSATRANKSESFFGRNILSTLTMFSYAVHYSPFQGFIQISSNSRRVS